MTAADTKDGDPSNMLVRAGYLSGLASKLDGADRDFALRASRSLICAARVVSRCARLEDAVRHLLAGDLTAEKGALRELQAAIGDTTAVACVQCLRPIEDARRSYASPTCYACLPPPAPLPLNHLASCPVHDGGRCTCTEPR